jgi:carbon monoxide dehydrogenase subunit G
VPVALATATAKIKANLPLEKVRTALTDISFVSSGIPDVKSVEIITETKAKRNVQVDFGFVHKTMVLESEVTSVEDTEMHFTANGTEAAMNGTASLKPISPNETEVTFVMNFEGRGPLKAIIDNFIQKKIKSDIQAFSQNMETKLNSLKA